MLQAYGEEILAAQARPLLNDLAVAALLLGSAVAARLDLDGLIPAGFPYVTFLPAIIVTALFCGAIPSVLATVVSAAVGTIWLGDGGERSPLYHGLDLALYCLEASGIILLAQGLKQAYRQLRERNGRLELMTGELNHRMRNLFQISGAIVSQSLRDESVNPQLLKTIAARLQSLSQSQELMGFDSKSTVSMQRLTATAVAALAPQPSRLIAQGPSLELSADNVMPLALVLHELATNALKYGAWSGPKGVVKIGWTAEAGKLVLFWQEHDGPPVEMPVKLGAGNKLIRSAIQEAVVDYHLERDGVRCRIELSDFCPVRLTRPARLASAEPLSSQ